MNENEMIQLKDNIVGQLNHQKALFESVSNDVTYISNKAFKLEQIIDSLYNLLAIMLHISYFDIQREQVTRFISHVEEYKDMAL